MSKVLKQRLYHLTLYNISEIQKGIQCYHAGIEYSLIHGNSAEYKQWANKDKTVIILNGGTTNSFGFEPYSNEEYFGTMQNHILELEKNGIKYSLFREPDLNNAITAIAFLVDERVWNKKDYPEISLFDLNIDIAENTIEKIKDKTREYYTKLYGKEVAFLREWLVNFRLA